MKSKNLFCFLLFVMIFSFASTAIAAAKKISNQDMADKLVAEGKIPMYVRDKGNFTYNPDFKIVGISGYNVNLRSQPNTKSNVIIQINDSKPEKWPAYLGEWIHPNGEHWVVGECRVNGKLKTVWIFGQYAKPMTKADYSSAKNSNAKLTDKEYKQMMKNSDFANADKALNQAWINAKNSLSESDFNALKKDQNFWIKRGRDNEAKSLMSKMSRVEAYTSVTNARTEYINQYANGATDLSSATNYENSGNIYDDVPDDLPDDLPDDVPSDSDEIDKNSSNENNAGKNINLNSSDDALNFLYERLIELEKIEPNENLEYLSDVDINGKKCFEFSASFNFNETGRYAVSQNGDIYEYDGSNFVPVK